MELYTRWPLGSGFFRSAKLSGCGAVGVRGSSLFLLRIVRGEGAPPFVHWAVGRHFHDFPFWMSTCCQHSLCTGFCVIGFSLL